MMFKKNHQQLQPPNLDKAASMKELESWAILVEDNREYNKEHQANSVAKQQHMKTLCQVQILMLNMQN